MLRQMQLCLKLKRSEFDVLEKIRQLCLEFPGDTDVVMYLIEDKRYVRPSQRMQVEITEKFYRRLCELLPAEQIGCIPSLASSR